MQRFFDIKQSNFIVLTLSLCLSLYLSTMVGLSTVCYGGGYVFAENNDVNFITHPIGYSGSSTTLLITVGIDPVSPNASDMEIPLKNILSVFNNQQVKVNNIEEPSSELGSAQVDFESVALHEFGHAMGLAHVNLASESGLSGDDQNYTKTEKGSDGSYNLVIGSDGVRGSEDDTRGDDVNLNWFKMADNNPFTIAATVDSTTYSRDIADLPVGQLFSANGDRGVAGLFGYSTEVAQTESVMQQGSYGDETQRRLTAEDVAALRYAMSGVDELADNGDDYTFWLLYAGQTTSADIVMKFDDNETGFAVTKLTGQYISGTHLKVTTAPIYFNTGFNWYFNPTYEFNTVTTQALGDITSTTATGNGEVTELGTPNPTAYGVCWNTAQYPTVNHDCTDEGGRSTTGTFTTNINSLSGNTTYYVRAYATNDNGTNYGNQVSFTTNSTAVPSLTTSSVTSVTTASASSGGNVSSDGGFPVTSRGVCWSTGQNPTTVNATTSDGIGIGSFTSSITGLQPGTRYYVRAYATNVNGITYGNQRNFTTVSTTPTVTTTSVSSVNVNSASSGGNVSLDGGSSVTSRGVCWSTGQNPTTADSKTSNGTGTGSFVSSITGLQPATLYYVRAYATNVNGTTYGNQRNFTTATTTSTVTTTSVSSVDANSASSGGNVSSDGGSSVTSRGVCWSTGQNPTTANATTNNSTGTGSFVSSITGLQPGTLYYVRAYATNVNGTVYGGQESFTTHSTYLLTVTRVGDGNGVVTSSPAGVDCGSDCFENYSVGINVALTAIADKKSEFLYWSGGCSGSGTCSVTMDQSQDINAHFSDGFPWSLFLPAIIGGNK